MSVKHCKRERERQAKERERQAKEKERQAKIFKICLIIIDKFTTFYKDRSISL